MKFWTKIVFLLVFFNASFAQHKFWDNNFKKIKTKAEFSVLCTESKTLQPQLALNTHKDSTFARDISSILSKTTVYAIDKGLEYLSEKYVFNQQALNAVSIPKDTLQKILVSKNFKFYINFCNYFYKKKSNTKTLAGIYKFRFFKDNSGKLILELDTVFSHQNYIPIKVSPKNNIIFTTFVINAFAVNKDGTKKNFDKQYIHLILIYGNPPHFEVYGKASYNIFLKNIDYIVFSIAIKQRNPFKEKLDKARKIIKNSPVSPEDLIKTFYQQ